MNKSSQKDKKSEESLDPLDIEKANVVYDRLRRAYNYGSDEELGERFDITKAGMSYRRKRGKWDSQELLDSFQDINYEWATSDSLRDLQTLPVRSGDPEVQRADSVDLKQGGLSDQARKELAQQIEEIARILKDSF